MFQTNGDAVSTRERIVLATIELIERYGIAGVTVRAIAEAAGANVAAVNYYFGSKDRLVEQVLESTMQHPFLDWDEMLADGCKPFPERLREVLRHLLWGMSQYPGISRTHFSNLMTGGPLSDRFAALMGGFASRLAEEAHRSRPGLGRRETATRVTALLSAAMLPGLLPEIFRPLETLDLSDPGSRERYIDALLARHFPSE